MRTEDFRLLAASVRSPLIELITSHLSEEYQLIPSEIVPSGHYWEARLEKFLDDESHIGRSLLRFQSEFSRTHAAADITGIFRSNDELFDALLLAESDGALKTVVEALNGTGVGNPPFVSIESKFGSPDAFYQALYDETICLLEPGNGPSVSTTVSCMMSERWSLLAHSNGRAAYHVVPYDKASMFPEAVRVRYIGDTSPFEPPKSTGADYVFVVMSFSESDPLLEDTFASIKRAVRRWRRSCVVQRVSDIEDDFRITDKILQCIERASVVIVDLTGERPNVYFELGYARGKSKRLVHMAREGTNLHFDVKDFNTIFYRNATDLEEKLSTRLKSMMKVASASD